MLMAMLRQAKEHYKKLIAGFAASTLIGGGLGSLLLWGGALSAFIAPPFGLMTYIAAVSIFAGAFFVASVLTAGLVFLIRAIKSSELAKIQPVIAIPIAKKIAPKYDDFEEEPEEAPQQDLDPQVIKDRCAELEEQLRKCVKDGKVFNVFTQAFAVTPRGMPLESKLRRLHNRPRCYMPSELSTLLEKVRLKEGSLKVVRFLLTADNRLLFALEGAPGGDTPAHFQMAHLDLQKAQCLTAGNAFFNEKGELCAINHKSGDFRPDFNTLQFIFPALIKECVKVADDFTIVKLNSSGVTVEPIKISFNEIKKQFEDSNLAVADAPASLFAQPAVLPNATPSSPHLSLLGTH